jgi:hypothetical protein
LLDKLCLCGAVLGIVLWQLFSDPIFAIMICLAVDCIGTIPTAVSAWHEPKNENISAWFLFLAGSFLMMYALPRWTFEGAAQPFVFALTQGVVLVVLVARPAFLRLTVITVSK